MKNLKFKGSRNYLHGSDIYNYFIKKNFKDIKIEFKKKIKFQPKIMSLSQAKNYKKKHCLIEYKNNRKIVKLGLTDSKKKISGRYDYNEISMYKHFKLYKKSASCNFKSNSTSIDVLIALNKFYNNKRIKLTKWYFTKLKLTKALDENILKKYTIKIKKNILNKFTITSIYKNKKKVGEIEYISND